MRITHVVTYTDGSKILKYKNDCVPEFFPHFTKMHFVFKRLFTTLLRDDIDLMTYFKLFYLPILYLLNLLLMNLVYTRTPDQT